jgi:hypothetical protein
MSDIIFTNTLGVSEDFKPKPAALVIPEWYKNLESYIGNEKKPSGDGVTTATIKRCMPVFDSITSGYIITTYVDVYVSQKELVDENNIPTGKKVPWYEWPAFMPIEWHPIIQAPTHPYKKNIPDHTSYPKWINAWSIKTPPGYSAIFLQPFHRESPFTILPGVVDTDTYTPPVSFPFVLNDWNFEGLIPAGTPIAQVIPFKRESWKMKFGDIDDFKSQDKVLTLLKSRFFDSYKTQFRKTKEYK